MNKLLNTTAELAQQYLSSMEQRQVFPDAAAIAGLEDFDEALPLDGCNPEELIMDLHNKAGAATVATAGPRYFGFVTGGALPATLASSWLTSTWDQNAHMVTGSPAAAKLEAIAARWLVEALALPSDCGVGFVTGATMANFSALAAARLSLLAKHGWDVREDGLFGAPKITVFVGEEVHISVLKALSLLGFGRRSLVTIPTDGQGRMKLGHTPSPSSPSLICTQAGNVNTGAFDPMTEIHEWAQGTESWIHVDGAFGLWARFCQNLDVFTQGLDQADSWATDAHKWLNVPYDSGLVFVRHAQWLHDAMRANAAYLDFGAERDPSAFTPELSRRARGIDVFTALKTLGKQGVAELVQRCCELAQLFSRELKGKGFHVLNDVVLNQVLVQHPTPNKTLAWIEAIQTDGTCWCGATRWQGQDAMRISVSSWCTTEEDVHKSIDAMHRLSAQL